MVLHQPWLLLLTDVGLELPYAVFTILLAWDAKVSH
jgi:hypothetical protein